MIGFGYKRHIIGVISGLLLIILGAVVLPVSFNAVKHSLVNKLMVLEPSSLVYKIWEEPPFIIYWNFYFFDVANPSEIIKGAKPSVVQRGPYVYRLEIQRKNVTINSNSTLFYKTVYTFFFEPGMSVGLESDSITALNVPYITAVHLLDWLPEDLKEALSLFLSGLGEHLFKKLTVKDLLWGYDDEIVKLISKLHPIPGMPDGQFGFLVDLNGTAHDDYTVFSGKDRRSRINWIELWNGNGALSWWPSPEANMINGTDGVIFHSFVTEDDTLHLFQPNLCRSMPYVFDRYKTIRGVPLSSFYLPPTVYQNSSVYPPNAGFCDGKTGNCGPSGQMRVDKCRYEKINDIAQRYNPGGKGLPASISNPHFLYGDSSLVHGVNGLAPDPNKHKNFLSVQPILGVTFELKFRLQLSLSLEKVGGISDMQHLIPVYFPVFWFEQSFEANDWMVNMYNSHIGVPTLACLIAEYVLVGLGALVVLLTIILGIRKYKSKQKEEENPLLSSDAPSTNYAAVETRVVHPTAINHDEITPII